MKRLCLLAVWLRRKVACPQNTLHGTEKKFHCVWINYWPLYCVFHRAGWLRTRAPVLCSKENLVSLG